MLDNVKRYILPRRFILGRLDKIAKMLEDTSQKAPSGEHGLILRSRLAVIKAQVELLRTETAIKRDLL